MKRCVGPRHGIVVTSVILAMFFGTSCVVAEDTPVAEFRVFVDGAILSQVDSNVVFSSQAGSLLARVTAANPANKPKDVLRALLLTSSQVTGIELTLELDNALSNQLGRNTEPVRKWEGTGLPNSTYFRNGDRYEFAGVTFTADQIPILLDHTGDSRVFHISMDEVNSTAYWRAISLPTFAKAFCMASGTDGTYGMELVAAVHYGSASLSRIPITTIKHQCKSSPTNSLARRTRLEFQYSTDPTVDVIECEQFNCGPWSSGQE
jgi:hypothetical protein